MNMLTMRCAVLVAALTSLTGNAIAQAGATGGASEVATTSPLDQAQVAAGTDLAEGAWSHGPQWFEHVGTWAPWALGAVWLFVVLRALLRRHRYRAMGVLDDAACARVHAAIAEAETHTVGEIVPVVVERSDGHPAAHGLAALFVLILGTALLLPVLPFDRPGLLLLCQLGLGALGYLSSLGLPDVQRLFIREARADEVTDEQAFQEFYRLGLHRTQAATGVLIFVSLLEHRVLVLGDEGIDAKMGEEHWTHVTKSVLDGILTGDLAGGLVAGVADAGQALAEHFPWTEGDRNEVPDRLVVRRE